MSRRTLFFLTFLAIFLFLYQLNSTRLALHDHQNEKNNTSTETPSAFLRVTILLGRGPRIRHLAESEGLTKSKSKIINCDTNFVISGNPITLFASK